MYPLVEYTVKCITEIHPYLHALQTKTVGRGRDRRATTSNHRLILILILILILPPIKTCLHAPGLPLVALSLKNRRIWFFLRKSPGAPRSKQASVASRRKMELFAAGSVRACCLFWGQIYRGRGREGKQTTDPARGNCMSTY